MSFTIICKECGNEQEFREGNNYLGENIEIEARESCGYQGCEVESIDIICNNFKCANYVSL